MPSSFAARTVRRNASTPRRWPSTRGKPRAAAQRPLPSMMMATCKGPPDRPEPSLAVAAALDIRSIPSDCEDFLFLGREQLIDFRDRAVRRLLNVGGQTLLVVLGDLVVLFELLDGVETVAAHVADRDPRGLG